MYFSKSRSNRIEKTQKILNSSVLRGLRLVGLLRYIIDTKVLQMVDFSDVILKIRFSIGTEFE